MQRFHILSQPVGLILYASVQWLLFVYFVDSGGFALGGDFALAQALCAPLFAFLSLSLRQVFVSGGVDGLTYTMILRLRLATTTIASLAIGLLLSAGAVDIAHGPLMAVTALKAIESLSDMLYARIEASGRSPMVGMLLALRGIVLVALIGAAIAYDAPVASFTGVLITAAFLLLGVELSVARQTGSADVESHSLVEPGLKAWLPAVLWLSIANLVITLAGFVPRYALDFFSTREAVGVFTAASMPATALLLVATGLAQGSLADVGAAARGHDRAGFWRGVTRSVILAGGLCLAVALAVLLLGESLVRLIDAEATPELVVATGLVTLIYLPALIAQVFSYSVLTLGTYRRLIPINLAALVAQCSLAAPLIRLDPVFGAALVAVIVPLVQIPLFWLRLRSHFGRVQVAGHPENRQR